MRNASGARAAISRCSGSNARLPIYRPLVGDDKLEIQELARKIGTYDISAEPFHDCCPMFQPRSPALFATPEALDAAEAELNMEALAQRAMDSLSMENFRYLQGKVQRLQLKRKAIA